MDISSSKITKIVNSLGKVNNETNQMIMNMASGTTKSEIISLFNQAALDFFNTVLTITKTLGNGVDNEIKGHMQLFQSALKYNINLPIDHFAGTILIFASEIYAEKEDFFLNMYIPDQEIDFAGLNTNNGGLGVIESEKFKKLWKEGDNKHKELLKDKIITLTSLCHAYFFKLSM